MPDLPKEPPFGSAWRIKDGAGDLVYIALCPGSETSFGGREWAFLAIGWAGWTKLIATNMVWSSYSGEALDIWEPAE